jgi:hypothetical protein
MPSFEAADSSFFSESSGSPARVVTPTTGSTVNMRSGGRSFYNNNSGTIAALTVVLPGGVDITDNVVVFGSKSAITALTLRDNLGNTVSGTNGLPTTMAANSTFAVCFVNKAVGWVLWT